MATLKLNEMAGKTVLAIVPAIHAKLMRLKLHAVDESGIWVEESGFTQKLLASAGLDAAEQQLIFLPFAQVTLLLQPAPTAGHHDLWHR